jgi:hypothetical protein
MFRWRLPHPLLTFHRSFTTTNVVLGGKKLSLNKIRVPTKKMQAVKAARKALKAPKNVYAEEKMTLEDAIAVLRVSSQATVFNLMHL